MKIQDQREVQRHGPTPWIVRDAPGGLPVRIRRQAPVSAEIADTVARAYQVNRRVFGRDLPFFDFVICDDDLSWKKESREYYAPWARAVALRDGTVVIKTPKNGGGFRAEFEELAKHEINHVFWCFLHAGRRERWCPFWLAEGLACHIAGRQYSPPAGALAGYRNKVASVIRLFPYRYRSGFLRSREDLIVYYALWSSFTGALLEAHGAAVVEVILRHAKQPGCASFSSLCQKMFGQPLGSLIREFVRTRVDALGRRARPRTKKIKKEKR